MKKGEIIKALSGCYYVKSDDGIYQRRARGLFRNKSESPLVGDIVEFQIENENECYITSIDDRHNFPNRPSVANIDQVLITMSLFSPKFSFYLLDRFIAYAEMHDIEPVIIVTKTDLSDDPELVRYIIGRYSIDSFYCMTIVN